jgi:hypothetical protein
LLECALGYLRERSDKESERNLANLANLLANFCVTPFSLAGYKAGYKGKIDYCSTALANGFCHNPLPYFLKLFR